MLIRPRKIYEKIGEKRLKKSGNSSGGRPMYDQDFETQKEEGHRQTESCFKIQKNKLQKKKDG